MNDSFGDRMKFYEGVESDRKFIPMIPTLARLDGRAFHSFCRGLKKPYDERLQNLMTEVTKYLVEETNACIGYTQSDEISLVWLNGEFKEQIFFNGRIMKMTSILAAMTSAKFNSVLKEYIPEKAHLMPLFDCRVWQVPNKTEAANTFLWRENDATKNSISAAAQSCFSHKTLQGLNGSQMQELLFSEKGINWNDYPSEFKRGIWLQRKNFKVKFSDEEIENLPAKHVARKSPNLFFDRRRVEKINMPQFNKVRNREDVIFEGDEPIIGE